jgi:Ca-activated chloride channel family protein
VRGQGGEVSYQPAQVFIDEHTLGNIARLTGGQYFRATDGEALRAIYGEIDRLEKGTNVAESYQRYVEGFPIPVLLGLGLLLLEILLINTRLRTVP